MKLHYFIWGNQSKELKDAANAKHKLLLGKYNSAEHSQIDCRDMLSMTADRLDAYFSDVIAQPSLFASERVVMASNTESINEAGTKKNAQLVLEKLSNLLKLNEPSTFFIFTASAKKFGEFKKGFQNAITSHCEIIQTLVTYDNFDPSAKIEAYALRHKVSLSQSAVAALITHVGGDLERLDNEIEKLSLVYGSDAKLNAEHIHNAVGGVKDWSLFQIQDAVSGKDMASFQQGMMAVESGRGTDIIPLFVMLGGKFLKLSAIADMLASGMPYAAVKKKIGGNDWLADKLIKETHAFTQPELANIAAVFAQNDLRVKFASGTSGSLIFRDLCEKIIRGDFVNSSLSVKFCRDLTY